MCAHLDQIGIQKRLVCAHLDQLGIQKKISVCPFRPTSYTKKRLVCAHLDQLGIQKRVVCAHLDQLGIQKKSSVCPFRPVINWGNTPYLWVDHKYRVDMHIYGMTICD